MDFSGVTGQVQQRLERGTHAEPVRTTLTAFDARAVVDLRSEVGPVSEIE